MIIGDHYWYFESAIPEKICDDIIKHCSTMKDTLGIVGNKKRKGPLSPQEIQEIKKIRNSNITFLSEKWLYREIHPFIHAANRNAKWNFQWDFTEPLQFTKYETNQYYGWHQDQHPEPFLGRNNFFDNKIRKLSSTLLLTDEKEYKGGDLEFAFFGHPNLKKTQKSVCKTRKKGSIIIFPSFVWHRVKPVTKGVRHSLVSWSLGYPYK